MTVNRLRRTIMTAACASLTLLAACGSGTIESALKPTRLVVFGDAISDVGQTGSKYTVNDGSVNTWLEQLAFHYGLTVTPSSKGGTVYARGNARVTATPDAAGDATTPTVTQQVDSFLATNAVGANDLVIINGGIGDVIAEMAAVRAGTQTEAQMSAKVQKAGQELGQQVIRLTNAGAKHVVVIGPYNLGKSPWATAINKVSVLTDATTTFNTELLVTIVGLGKTALYVDAALYHNLVLNAPAAYNIADATKVVCTSIDPGNGIGIGTNQINSRLCNTSTIAAGLDYNKQAFADNIYFTPTVNRQFGTYAYDRIRAVW
jgi:outer membrane lipase/esterase